MAKFLLFRIGKIMQDLGADAGIQRVLKIALKKDVARQVCQVAEQRQRNLQRGGVVLLPDRCAEGLDHSLQLRPVGAFGQRRGTANGAGEHKMGIKILTCIVQK